MKYFLATKSESPLAVYKGMNYGKLKLFPYDNLPERQIKDYDDTYSLEVYRNRSQARDRRNAVNTYCKDISGTVEVIQSSTI